MSKIDLKSLIKQSKESAAVTEMFPLNEGSDVMVRVKKFARKDRALFSPDIDIASAMVFAGVVEEDGTRVFESIEEVMELEDGFAMELFMLVNTFNKTTVSDQAKK